LRYFQGHTNEETAQLMGMNMNTFYNKHKMAKEQFIKVLRKEEQNYG
jgi:DNA-directed RNA polymerase specialized sigma24 family protein